MIALSVGAANTFTGERPPSKMLAGTADGIVTLHRTTGEPWRIGERTLAGKHVSSILIEPAHRTIYAGVYKGGVYASADGGATWNERNEGLSDQHVYCLAAGDGGAPLYCGVEPASLFRSDDRGETWQAMPQLRAVPSTAIWNFPAPPFAAHVKSVALDAKRNRLFVGVEQGALLRSDDGGTTFRDLHGFFNDIHRIAIDPSDSDVVLISTGAGVYRSTDGGERWTRTTTNDTGIGYPDALVIDPRDPRTVFIAGSHATPGTWRKTHTANARVLRSRNGGIDWEIVRTGLPEHLRGNVEAMSFAVAAGGAELYAGTTDGDIFMSADEGERWTRIAGELPPISKFGHYLALTLPVGGR